MEVSIKKPGTYAGPMAYDPQVETTEPEEVVDVLPRIAAHLVDRGHAELVGAKSEMSGDDAGEFTEAQGDKIARDAEQKRIKDEEAAEKAAKAAIVSKQVSDQKARNRAQEKADKKSKAEAEALMKRELKKQRKAGK